MFSDILKMSAPLLFAVLGALVTEYAGAMAIFMEGAITFSGFLAAAFTIATGSPVLGFLFSSILTAGLIYGIAFFTFKTKANPFLVGIAVNLFSTGFTSYCTVCFFSHSSAIVFADFTATAHIKPVNTLMPAFTAISFAIFLFLFLRFTHTGLALRFSSEPDGILRTHGINSFQYKVYSWAAAGFFAACAGASLVFRLGAFTVNLSAGRGWTALAAIFLGFKNPLFCIAAVFIFSLAEYAGNIMQSFSTIPPAFILSAPYIVALLIFIFSSSVKELFLKSR